MSSAHCIRKGAHCWTQRWPCEPYHSDNSSLYVILPRAVRCISSPILIIIFGLHFYEDLSQQQEFWFRWSYIHELWQWLCLTHLAEQTSRVPSGKALSLLQTVTKILICTTITADKQRKNYKNYFLVWIIQWWCKQKKLIPLPWTSSAQSSCHLLVLLLANSRLLLKLILLIAEVSNK